jgi:hypothetical protein
MQSSASTALAVTPGCAPGCTRRFHSWRHPPCSRSCLLPLTLVSSKNLMARSISLPLLNMVWVAGGGVKPDLGANREHQSPTIPLDPPAVTRPPSPQPEMPRAAAKVRARQRAKFLPRPGLWSPARLRPSSSASSRKKASEKLSSAAAVAVQATQKFPRDLRGMITDQQLRLLPPEGSGPLSNGPPWRHLALDCGTSCSPPWKPLVTLLVEMLADQPKLQGVQAVQVGGRGGPRCRRGNRRRWPKSATRHRRSRRPPMPSKWPRARERRAARGAGSSSVVTCLQATTLLRLGRATTITRRARLGGVPVDRPSRRVPGPAQESRAPTATLARSVSRRGGAALVHGARSLR